MKQLYQELATLVQARLNCANMPSHAEWFERHGERAAKLVDDYMPSGSGWDNGTTLDLERSTPDKLVFYGSYHHMDDCGHYDGWTDHEIFVRPSLANGFDLTITGPNRNDIKEYLHQIFDAALRVPGEPTGSSSWVPVAPQPLPDGYDLGPIIDEWTSPRGEEVERNEQLWREDR